MKSTRQDTNTLPYPKLMKSIRDVFLMISETEGFRIYFPAPNPKYQIPRLGTTFEETKIHPSSLKDFHGTITLEQ